MKYIRLESVITTALE